MVNKSYDFELTSQLWAFGRLEHQADKKAEIIKKLLDERELELEQIEAARRIVAVHNFAIEARRKRACG